MSRTGCQRVGLSACRAVGRAIESQPSSVIPTRRRIAAAIAGRAFRPVFRPIIELSTGRTVSFEALTRFDNGPRPDETFAAAVGCGFCIELEP